MKTNNSNLISFTILKEDWDEFEIKAEIEGMSAQNMIRKWIDEYINGTKE